jgi:Protein of unknown function (DUF3089)
VVAAAASAAMITLAAASCGSGASSTASAAASPASASATTSTVWLCRPGQVDDPCSFPLQSTVVPASGRRTTATGHAATNAKFDCFYVYPTVSTQPTDNSNLTVQRTEVAAAIAQASRFSQVCRVWAPMYRQRTEVSLLQGLGADQHANTVAYDSLLSAFRDYIAHDNDGRPIVFIGHSQGAAMLIRLLASQVDPDPPLRARTVVAILAGGNVTVPDGKTHGATFRHLPLCTTTHQIGCVIAYSSFPSQPPADSDFGRPGAGVSLQSGQTATKGLQVACVNPAAIAGGTADLDPYFPTATSTPPPPPVSNPWVSYPGLYSAACRHAAGATWLQVNTLTVAGRPVVTESLGPAWGYHLDDINLALGNLVHDVETEEAAYASHH